MLLHKRENFPYPVKPFTRKMRLMEKKRIMKKLFILAFLLFATHSNVPAQLSKQEMRNDLEVFATTLPQKHLNLFAKLDKKDFEKKISTLNARIDSLDEESFFIELFQIIKAVGDEHTRLFPNQSNYQLPIVFSVFKEGCFVTESTRPELLYGKLTAINGISMKEILRRYKKIINDENPSYFNISLPRYLNNTFILKGLGITSTKDSVVCSFSDGKGDTIVTTLKPEGTLSLLPTVSSGVHYSHSPYYIRRVRISAADPLCRVCEDLGYPVLPEVGQDPLNPVTKVVEFPVKAPAGRVKADVSAIEQLENYKMFMTHYVDHNCSITIHVRDNEWDDVEQWVWDNWDDVVALSFLSYDDSFYELMPYEEISQDEYERRKEKMKAFNPSLLSRYEHEETELDIGDSECVGGVCPVR